MEFLETVVVGIVVGIVGAGAGAGTSAYVISISLPTSFAEGAPNRTKILASMMKSRPTIR